MKAVLVCLIALFNRISCMPLPCYTLVTFATDLTGESLHENCLSSSGIALPYAERHSSASTDVHEYDTPSSLPLYHGKVID